MNYIELFANGGLTKSEKSEGEQRAMQLLESLQELTGVDPKQAAEILNQFKDDPETVNSIQEYVNLAIDPQSDENTRSNAISELTKIFNPSMESQYFKCGGKLQQLVTKFRKGGPVDCGCGGIKLDNGGKTISADGSITIVNPNTAQADTLGRYSYPSTNGKFQLLSNGERSATVWDNTGGFPIARYANETFMQNHPVRSFLGGYKPAPAGYFENLVDRVNNRFDENGVPTKQEGGTVELTQLPGHDVNTTLTRRQARQLAMDKGRYANNAQFQSAMANAMNAARSMGLRGKEMRERAREMVAGIVGADRSLNVPNQLNIGNISGPARAGIVSSGDLIMLNPEGTVSQPKPTTQPQKNKQPEFTGPSVIDSLAAQRAKTNAWYQYQYERALYDQANHNYRPNQGSAEYQHWMWKDFNDAWDDNTSSVKRDFLMRSPSSQELNAFRGAGQFTHGVLPWSRADRESYGVDYNKRQFYFNDDSRYRADAQAGGIPASSNLYEGLAKALAPVVVGVPAAGIISGALTGSEAADAALGEIGRPVNPSGIEMELPKARYREIDPATGKFKYTRNPNPDGPGVRKPSTRLFDRNSRFWNRTGSNTPIKDWEKAGNFIKADGGQIEKAQNGRVILGPNGKPVPKVPFVTSDGTVVDPMNIESLAKFYNVPFVRRDFNNPAGYAVERTITVYPNGQRDTTGLFNAANLSNMELEEMRRGKDIKTQALRQHFNKPGTFRAKSINK